MRDLYGLRHPRIAAPCSRKDSRAVAARTCQKCRYHSVQKYAIFETDRADVICTAYFRCSTSACGSKQWDSNSTETRRGQRNGCENMSDDEVEANAYRLFIGILIAIIGGLVSSFGLVFQKYAHKLNEALPKEERGNCKVITGFIIYILGTAIFLVASPYAPQSVLAALASVNLVGNAIWAPMLLKENIGKVDFTGLFFICGGIVLVVVLGTSAPCRTQQMK